MFEGVTAEELVGKAVKLLEVGRYQEAFEAFTTVLISDKKHLAATLGMSKVYQQLGELDKAGEWYGKFVAMFKEDTVRYTFLGEVCYLFSEYDKALEHFERAVVCGPTYTIAWNGMGHTYWAMGELQLALESYEMNY